MPDFDHETKKLTQEIITLIDRSVIGDSPDYIRKIIEDLEEHYQI